MRTSPVYVEPNAQEIVNFKVDENYGQDSSMLLAHAFIHQKLTPSFI